MTGSLIVLAAGGTGGHLFPAEALARALLARAHRVALITDKRGGVFPVEGVPTHVVAAGRIGPGVATKVRAAVDSAIGMFAATRLLRKLKPTVVVGFGGYPSLPPLLAAAQLGLPTITHDQNAVLGRANRMLSHRVKRIATSFEQVLGLDESQRRKTVETGNPVRPTILALRNIAYRPPDTTGLINLLITGGSLGARILSDVVPAAILRLPPVLRSRLKISQQVREEDVARVKTAYAGSGLDIEIRSFFSDIPDRLGRAQLVICRAGGSTTAELTVAGRPAILVPFAAAIADEQTANAQNLIDRGAGWLLLERDFTAPALAQLIERLLSNPELLMRASAEAHALGQPGAAELLADLVESVEREAQP